MPNRQLLFLVLLLAAVWLSFIGFGIKIQTFLVFSVTADEMSESRQTHVTLHDIDPQALEQLVQYAYTAEIMVGEGNVQVEILPI